MHNPNPKCEVEEKLSAKKNSSSRVLKTVGECPGTQMHGTLHNPPVVWRPLLRRWSGGVEVGHFPRPDFVSAKLLPLVL